MIFLRKKIILSMYINNSSVFIIYHYPVYLYAFTLYAGQDRVFQYQGLEKKLNFSEGDLIQIQEQYFLVLWNQISFQEQYSNIPTMSGVVQIIQKRLLTEKTIQLMHRMVYQRYTTYKSVMKYFLSKDIPSLLKKATKSWKRKYKKYFLQMQWKSYEISPDGQTLIIFPDLWTLYNTLPESILAEKNLAVLHSSSTQNQKDKAWRWIKQWQIQILATTYAQIFQDFSKLQNIIQIDPHKWYYANQQDPRYKTWIVIEKMQEIWKIE